MGFEVIPDEVERTAREVIGAAIEVHRQKDLGSWRASIVRG